MMGISVIPTRGRWLGIPPHDPTTEVQFHARRVWCARGIVPFATLSFLQFLGEAYTTFERSLGHGRAFSVGLFCAVISGLLALVLAWSIAFMHSRFESFGIPDDSDSEFAQTASLVSRLRMQYCLLFIAFHKWVGELIWVTGDDTLREAFPIFHPVFVVLPAVVFFPLVFKMMFGRVGAQLLLWLPHLGILFFGRRIPAPALRFDLDGWVDPSTRAAFYTGSMATTIVAIYLFSRRKLGEQSSNGVGAEMVGRMELAISSEGSDTSGRLVLDEVSLAPRGSNGSGLDGVEFGSEFNPVPDYWSWKSSGSDSSASSGFSTFVADQFLAWGIAEVELDERDAQSSSPRGARGGFLQRGTPHRPNSPGQL